jgi:TRAP-type C4-dicarboxylate transport system permease large subunit
MSSDSIRRSITDTAKQTAMIFAIAIGAKAFVGFIAFTGVATDLATMVNGWGLPPLAVMLLLSLVYIVLGMFMDPLGIMLLTLPVVVPTIQALGFDLIWFGVIMVKYLEIGMITPPVGLNVFVLKAAVGKTIQLEQIFRGVTLFLVMDVITLAILIGFPEITLWLPSLM